MRKISLAGKNGIITGGSRGLGLEIAKAFVTHGSNVVICSRSNDELAEAVSILNDCKQDKEQLIGCIKCDICSQDEVDKLFDFATNTLGAINVLVNNAGIQGPIGTIDNNDWEYWCDTIKVDLIGTAYCMRKAIAIFKEQNTGGRIINLSGGGATGSRPNYSAYAAAKTGVVRLTESLADEAKEYGIYINAVAPGALNTRMLDETLEAGADAVGLDEYNKAIDRSKNGGSSLVNAAELICYLGSDASNKYNGRLLSAVWDDWMSESDDNIENDKYKLRRIV